LLAALLAVAPPAFQLSLEALWIEPSSSEGCIVVLA
jgi:hypothetical protein